MKVFAAIVLLLLRLFMPDEFFGVSLTSGTIGDTFELLIVLTLLGGIIVLIFWLLGTFANLATGNF